MTLIWADDFNRGDYTSLGSTSVGNKPWVVVGGFTITGLSAVVTADDSMAMVNSGSPNGKLRVTVPTMTLGGGSCFIFRSDGTRNNRWFYNFTQGTVVKVVGGVGTTVASNLNGAGGGQTVEIEVSGTTLIFRNITTGATNTVTLDSDLATQTHWGFRGNDGNARFEDPSFETSPAYADEVLIDGPHGYWKLDETSGITSVDSANNVGQLAWNAAPSWAQTGLVAKGTAATLNGTQRGGVNPGVSSVDGYTVELWVKTLSSGNDSLVSRDSGGMAGSPNRHWSLHLSAGTLHGWAGNGGTFATLVGPAINDGVAHHVVMTCDGGTARLYVDGAQVAASVGGAPSGSLTDTVQPIYLGGNYAGSPNFTGTFDEFAFYTKALSATRVAAHYAARTSIENQTIVAKPPPKGGMWAVSNVGFAGYTTPHSNGVQIFSAVGLPYGEPHSGGLPVFAEVLASIKPGKGQLSEVIKRDNPRGYWQFEEPSTATQFIDSMNGGILQERGDVTAGVVGYAADSKAISGFSAANYLDWPTQPDIVGAHTVECLFKVSSLATNVGLFGTRGGSDQSTSAYINTTGNLIIDIGSGTAWLGQVTITNATIVAAGFTLNNWSHLGVVARTNGYDIYLNGIKVATGSYSGTPLLTNATHPLRVGQIGPLFTAAYNGANATIDEFAVYDKALTADRFLVRNDVDLATGENAQFSGFTGWGIPI